MDNLNQQKIDSEIGMIDDDEIIEIVELCLGIDSGDISDKVSYCCPECGYDKQPLAKYYIDNYYDEIKKYLIENPL